MSQAMFHVTVLSNFPRAYEKYSGRYDKAQIKESTYPTEFYLLTEEELAIGFEKAGRLLTKLGVSGDRLLVLRTEVPSSELHPNERTRKGAFIKGSAIKVAGVYFVQDQQLAEISVEEAMAEGLALTLSSMRPYVELTPRSFSVLPIPLACQAACRFCFSKASVSIDTEMRGPLRAPIREWAIKAREQGAERFVITGGGEPGLIKHADLLALISEGASIFPKTVLISNGVHLARRDDASRHQMLRDYRQAGLSVLAISRHHHDDNINFGIMGLQTKTGQLANSWARLPANERPERLRLICVLQKGGVDSKFALRDYIKWAVEQGVPELCFKELYVSTTLESAYHQNPENDWSREHQIPLSIVSEVCEEAGFERVSRLPWGAPVYQGQWNGRLVTIAAYTEPSLYWERVNGIARSWNFMADEACLVSLEDLSSDINTERAKFRKHITIQKVQ